MTSSDVFSASAMKTDAALQRAKDYLAMASHCESEAAKAQDKFLRYQLLSFAESYRTLAESTAALERSEGPLKTCAERHKAARDPGEPISALSLRVMS